jgi:hypothetical protein
LWCLDAEIREAGVFHRRVGIPTPLRRGQSIPAGHLRPAGTVLRWQERGASQVIRKLKDGRYRLYSRKVDPRTGRRRNLGTFATRAEAEQHERAVQFFKRRRGARAPAGSRLA